MAHLIESGWGNSCLNTLAFTLSSADSYQCFYLNECQSSNKQSEDYAWSGAGNKQSE
jgi:hypothetical protein